MKRILLCLCFLSLCSCENKQAEQSTGNDIDTTAFGKKLADANYQVELLPKARKMAGQWIEYITAQNEIERFRDASLRDVMENAAPLAEIMRSLESSVPDSLRTNAVEARLSVLSTKAQLLEYAAAKRDPKPREIEKISEEIPAEFNNFKIQLNEIFLKSLEDFEDELDRLQEENLNSRDSLAQARDSILTQN